MNQNLVWGFRYTSWSLFGNIRMYFYLGKKNFVVSEMGWCLGCGGEINATCFFLGYDYQNYRFTSWKLLWSWTPQEPSWWRKQKTHKRELLMTHLERTKEMKANFSPLSFWLFCCNLIRFELLSLWSTFEKFLVWHLVVFRIYQPF